MAGRDWAQFLEGLGRWGTVVEASRGVMRVTLPGVHEAPRSVEIRMTPEDWQEMVGIPWGGDVALAMEDVRRSLDSLADDQHYLVYRDYRLEPSGAPELAEDPDDARITEWLRREPGQTGRWVTLDG